MNRSIGDITMADMEDYRRLRLTQDQYQGRAITPATVNRDVTMLKTMLQKAVVWGYIERNPLYGMEMLQEHNKREVEITPEEIESLARKLTPTMGDIVRFGAYSSLRLENVIGLRN